MMMRQSIQTTALSLSLSLMIALVICSNELSSVNAFLAHSNQPQLQLHHAKHSNSIPSIPSSSSSLYAANRDNLTSLPKGISPFEKSLSKNLNLQLTFREIAKKGVDAAIASRDTIQTRTGTGTGTGTNEQLLLEIEFPPLLGGAQAKSQFDDFDNIQELDSNKDWTMQFAPLFFDKQRLLRSPNNQEYEYEYDYKNGKTWLVFPDTKECELARKEWQGGRYQAATFTTIEAATEFLVGEGGYDAPWGAALANGLNKIMGSAGGGGNADDNDDNNNNGGKDPDGGLLGDTRALDKLTTGENAPATLNLVIQPGNGGPVEDWINCEKIHDYSAPESVMVIVNGALDKVRDGYYPAVFFPKLAATVERFYNKFESVFYLKPISDKGVYGWLYRVYPEPWQVVLQTVLPDKDGKTSYVEDTVVYVSDERPSYNEAVAKLLEGSAKIAASS